LEIYAGGGGLSKSLGDTGLNVLEALEAYPAKGVYLPYHDMDNPAVIFRVRKQILSGNLKYVHFGIPCSSWSQLQSINGGTRRNARPEGDGTLEREAKGNSQAKVVSDLCRLQSEMGNYYSVENPLSSFLWKCECFVGLKEDTKAVGVEFCQCVFGLGVNIDEGGGIPQHRRLIKKPTRILTNMRSLLLLKRDCACSKPHLPCYDTVICGGKHRKVSCLAGVYPPELCSEWAKIVAETLDQSS
jgi:hypothetical protein